jgi:formylglycine-generating enzyme required for sulfatase activity
VQDIFERGIDPDVDDPSKIHSHSEVPTSESDWPTCAEVLAFRDRVRARVRGIYDDIEAGTTAFSRHVGRVLFMTFEHEAMHAETLLYMLIQSPLTRAPTSVATPQWDALARRWAQEKKDNKVLFISGGTIAMGHNDLEAEDDTFPGQHGWADHEFGWDNEHPATPHQVNAFKIDSLPVSNAEYLAFLEKSGVDANDADKLPASWVRDDSGEWKIRTLYGSVDFNVGGDWPLQASKLELDAFANAKGGRLPTEGELRLLWDHPEGPRPAGESANIGVRNWHPVP